MKKVTLFALISNQGTACIETCLCQKHFTKENKEKVSKHLKNDVVPDSWTDVSENEACECLQC